MSFQETQQQVQSTLEGFVGLWERVQDVELEKQRLDIEQSLAERQYQAAAVEQLPIDNPQPYQQQPQNVEVAGVSMNRTLVMVAVGVLGVAGLIAIAKAV